MPPKSLPLDASPEVGAPKPDLGEQPTRGDFLRFFQAMPEPAALNRIVSNEAGEAVDYAVIEANSAYERLTGIPRPGNASPPPFFDHYRRVATTQEPFSFQAYLPELAKHFQISVSSPAKNWFVTLFSDISVRVQEEQQIRRLNRLLSKLNYAILRATSQENLFKQACDICVESGGLKMAWIGIPDPVTQRFIPAAITGDAEGYVSKIEVYVDGRPRADGPAGRCFRENQPEVCNDFPNDPRLLRWREVALEYGLRALVCLPVLRNGEPFATLNVYSGEKDHFRQEEVELLMEVAESLSFALDHLEQDERRRTAERRLSESENKFRVLFETSRDAILILDENGIFDCNQAALNMFGFSRKEELHSKSPWTLSPSQQPDGSNSMTAAHQRCQLAIKEGSQFFEWEHRRADGSRFPAEVLLTRFELHGQTSIQAVVRDNTERKEAEKELRNLSRAVAQSPASIMITDLEGKIEYVNPKFTSVTGYAPEEVLGLTPRLLQSGKTEPAVYADLWTTILSGKEWRGELLNRKKNGELYWTSASISPIANSRGEMVKFLSVKEDITEKKQRVAAIEENESRFRQLTENLESVFWMESLNKHSILYVSPAYEKIWGRSCESLYEDHESWLKAIHPEDRARMDTIYKEELAGQNYDETYRIIRPDGGMRWIHDRAFIIRNAQGEAYRVAGIAEDITERRQLNEQFLRFQRTESIGNLASGLAHDLNNVLSPILMAISMLKEQLTDPLNAELVTTIEESAERGADIVKQVLTFARGAEGALAKLSPEPLINQIGRIIQKTFPKSISYRQEIPKGIWSINANPTQIHQVLLNLCVNARDAMPEGGTLTVSAENSDIDESCAAMMTDAYPGQFVLLKVADNGSGIPGDVLKRIFDPFFTTKQVERGTGLGLSTVQSIVKSHHGFMKVESEPGSGTVFHVFLPATNDALSLQPPQEATPALPKANGTCVLLVDDEEMILSVMGRVLLKAGYHVLTARNGIEALTVYCTNLKKVKVVVTDVMMPQMDGVKLARGLLKLNPRLPIIASSGNAEEASRKELAELGVGEFLRKPYHTTALLETLQRVCAATLTEANQ